MGYRTIDILLSINNWLFMGVILLIIFQKDKLSESITYWITYIPPQIFIWLLVLPLFSYSIIRLYGFYDTYKERNA